MAYVDYTFYSSLYTTPPMEETDFNRYVYDACRKVDMMTAGNDGVKKLKIAFPTDEDDVMAVKRCVVAIVDIMHRIRQAEENLASARGYTTRADGNVQGKVVTSVSAGNESISFSSGSSSAATIIDKALADNTVQTKLYRDTITKYLSGVPDANGVGLLFMGNYPYKVG